MKDQRLNSLLSLLEDCDQNVACTAMAEILHMPEGVDDILAQLQDSNDAILRRRAHQMQAIISIRRRRAKLGERLLASTPNLLSGLIELHMLWYDEDLEAEIISLWNDFLKQAEAFQPVNATALISCLKHLGLTPADPGEAYPDHHCIGAVLEDLAGADYMVCIIGRQIGEKFGWRGKVVSTNAWGFCLLDSRERQLIVPSRNWRIKPCESGKGIEPWNDSMLLHYAASMLFLEAIRSDSPRYTYTLGMNLVKSCQNGDFDKILPYPIGKQRRNQG